MAWWWIPAIIAGISIARLTWSVISNWFTDNTQIDSSYGQIVKKHLTNGKYEVVTHVFNKHGSKTASAVWKPDELGDDLNLKFINSDPIVIGLN